MRVLFTYDYVVSSEKSCNISYCFDFLFRMFRCMDVSVDVFSESKFKYSRETFLDLCNIPINFDPNDLYYPILYEDLTSKAVEYILSFLKGYDLILTYEASETFRKVLEDNSILYLDIWLSPIRFCKDLMLSFYSNDFRIKNVLEKYKMNESEICKCAKIVSDQFRCFVKIEKEKHLNPGSALLISQLPKDKSVLSGRKFLTLLDFCDDIKKLSERYTKIYLLKHPLMKFDDFKKIWDGLSDIKNLELLEGVNTYYLLSKEEVKGCIGISSSVLVEAKYFGKEVRYLYKPALSDRYVNIYKHYYNSRFWGDVFGLDGCDEICYLAHDNFLRNRFSYYSYSIFRNQEEAYSALQSLYRLLKNLDKSKEYILYGFGSIGRLILPFLLSENIKVKAIADKNLSGEWCGNVRVIKPDEIEDGETVIITPFVYKDEIKEELGDRCNLIFVL